MILMRMLHVCFLVFLFTPYKGTHLKHYKSCIFLQTIWTLNILYSIWLFPKTRRCSFFSATPCVVYLICLFLSFSFVFNVSLCVWTVLLLVLILIYELKYLSNKNYVIFGNYRMNFEVASLLDRLYGT